MDENDLPSFHHHYHPQARATAVNTGITCNALPLCITRKADVWIRLTSELEMNLEVETTIEVFF